MSLADEGGVEDETVLGGVALGLERAEQSLFGAEDLDRGRRVLGQVGERARVRDEAGANDVADESREVGSNLMRDLGVDQSAAWFGMCGAEGSCQEKQKRARRLVGRVCQSGACNVTSRRLQIRSVIGET